MYLRLPTTFAVIYGSFTLGFYVAIQGPTLMDLADLLHVNIDIISYSLAFASLAYSVGGLLSGFLFNYVNRQLLIVFYLLFFGTVNIVTPFIGNYTIFSVITVLKMICAGGVDCAGNVWILEMWPGKDSWLQALHFAFAVGCALGPLVVEPFLSVEPNNGEHGLDKMAGKSSGSAIINDQNNESRIYIPFGAAGSASILAALAILWLYVLQLRFRSKQERLKAKEAGGGPEHILLNAIQHPNQTGGGDGVSFGVLVVSQQPPIEAPRQPLPTIDEQRPAATASDEDTTTDDKPASTQQQQQQPPAPANHITLGRRLFSHIRRKKTRPVSPPPPSGPAAPELEPLQAQQEQPQQPQEQQQPQEHQHQQQQQQPTEEPELEKQLQQVQLEMVQQQQQQQPAVFKITSRAKEQTEGRPPYYVMFAVLLAAMCLSFYCGIEITSMNYLATFAHNTDLQLTKSTAAFMSSALTISFAVGRGFGIFIAIYMKPHRLFYMCTAIMAVGNVSMLIVANTVERLLWYSICVFGIGCGPMFPAIVSFFDDRISKVTNTVSGIFILGSMFNVALNSLIIGQQIVDNAIILIVCNLIGSVVLLLLFGTLHILTKVKKSQRVKKFKRLNLQQQQALAAAAAAATTPPRRDTLSQSLSKLS